MRASIVRGKTFSRNVTAPPKTKANLSSGNIPKRKPRWAIRSGILGEALVVLPVFRQVVVTRLNA